MDFVYSTLRKYCYTENYRYEQYLQTQLHSFHLKDLRVITNNPNISELSQYALYSLL